MTSEADNAIVASTAPMMVAQTVDQKKAMQKAITVHDRTSGASSQ